MCSPALWRELIRCDLPGGLFSSHVQDISADGQVIVGLLHGNVGHLGIFVSGKVAKKEHAQIVSVLKSIEMLPPGLYGMAIHERKGRDGNVEYEVDFTERRRVEAERGSLDRMKRVN